MNQENRRDSRSAEALAWERFSRDYERTVVSVTSFRRKRHLLVSEMLSGIVVDLGCGPLGLLARGAVRVPGTRVIALDFCLPMILESRRRFQSPNLNYLVADNRDVPLRSDSVDTVFSVNSIIPTNRSDVDLMFREAARILRRGGRLVAVLPAFEMTIAARDKWGMPVEIDMEGHRELDTSGWQCFYTEGDITELMTRHSFTRYRVSRIVFSTAEEIAHIRTVYAKQLLGVATEKLDAHPLFEHLLVAEK